MGWLGVLKVSNVATALWTTCPVSLSAGNSACGGQGTVWVSGGGLAAAGDGQPRAGVRLPAGPTFAAASQISGYCERKAISQVETPQQRYQPTLGAQERTRGCRDGSTLSPSSLETIYFVRRRSTPAPRSPAPSRTSVPGSGTPVGAMACTDVLADAVIEERPPVAATIPLNTMLLANV